MQMSGKVLLRSLKGAPLSVVVALFMFGSANRQELISWTGWEKSSVDKALRLLEDYEVIVRPSYRKWALSEGGRQLPLFNYPLDGPSNPQLVDNVANYPLDGRSDANYPPDGPSALVSSSRSILTNKDDQPQPDRAILDACKELGIYGRKRDELARLVHVVEAGPEYVRDHVAGAENVGLAIWRLEQGWDVSERPSTDPVPERYRDVVVR